MNRKWNILLKGLAAVGAVIVICISISHMIGIGSETLGDIAREHPQPTMTPGPEAENPQSPAAPDLSQAAGEGDDLSGPVSGTSAESVGGTPAESIGGISGEAPSSPSPGGSANLTENVPESDDAAYPIESPDATGADRSPMNHDLPNKTEDVQESVLPGFSLNGDLMADARVTWTDGFYYEPLSDGLTEYITGVSYPADLEQPAITTDELSYVHVLYTDFDGNSQEGELICNQSIAPDLVEIFHELYRAEYRIEKIRLIDAYEGDDDLSMADNNTSCFNYRVVSGSSSLSRHAYGLAIDINPLYNPYITYNRDQTITVSPAAGADYADRSKAFPYKIDEDDLCCRLFKEHGFIWGGNWNSCKDYQHFQKTP